VFTVNTAASLKFERIQFRNGQNGLVVSATGTAAGAYSIELDTVVARGNAQHGVSVTIAGAADVSLVIDDSKFAENGGMGASFAIGGASLAVSVDETEALRNEGGWGLRFDDDTGGASTYTLADTNVAQNTKGGLIIDASGAVGDASVSIKDSSFDGNAGNDGARIVGPNAFALDVSADESSFDGNVGNGLDARSPVAASTYTASLTKVRANANSAGFGVWLGASGTTGDASATLARVEAESNSQSGVRLAEAGAGNFAVTLTHVAASGNGNGDGTADNNVHISEAGNGNLNLSAADVTSNSSNGGSGTWVGEADAGTLAIDYAGKSESNDNTKYGLFASEDGDGLSITNYARLTADGNGDASLWMSTGTITN